MTANNKFKFYLLSAILMCSSFAKANSDDLRLKLGPDKKGINKIYRNLNKPQNITSEPDLKTWRLKLNSQSEVRVSAQASLENVANFISKGIKETYSDYHSKFSDLPPLYTHVRLIPKEVFHSKFKLPNWTNAIFYKREILLPISQDIIRDLPELNRSIKHEFVHALIHTLGDGKAPGWIDEGLAQWSEGSVHSSLPKIFRDWLTERRFLPTTELAKGFTQLELKKVPIAYAQSLYATRELIKRYGFKPLSTYFALLREDVDEQTAFLTAFGESEDQFNLQAELAVRRLLGVSSSNG